MDNNLPGDAPVVLQGLTKYYGALRVPDGFSLALPARGRVCLFGPSGCGKTTLLRLLCGLDHADGGTISGLEGRRTAVVFQEDRLLPWRTALENVSLVLHGPDAAETARRHLSAFGLADAAGKYPDALSGGMRRRVALARAAAYGGELLLLDEPFQGLDAAAKQTAMTYLRQRFAHALILLVTHDPSEAKSFAERTCDLAGPPLRLMDKDKTQGA